MTRMTSHAGEFHLRALPKPRMNLSQRFVTVMMKGPAPDRPADGRQRPRAGRRHEAVRGGTSLPHRLPRSKHKTEKVERLIWEVTAPVRILAIDHSSSSQDAAPGCKPQGGRPACSITPALPWRSCSDKWRHLRSDRTGCEDGFSSSTRSASCPDPC